MPTDMTISMAGYIIAPTTLFRMARRLPTISANRSNISVSLPLDSPAEMIAQ